MRTLEDSMPLPLNRLVLALPPAALLLSACTPPEFASLPLQELAQDVVVDYDEADATTQELWIESAVERYDELLATFEGDLNEESIGGRLDALPDALAGILPLEESMVPSAAVGVFTMRPLPCSWQRLREIVLEPEQEELWTDTYDLYEREFTSDVQCFIDGTCDRVNWTSIIEQRPARPLPYSLSYLLYNELTAVQLADGTEGLLNRIWMPEPAESSDPNVGQYRQTYQAEIYRQLPDGDVLHVYVMWTESILGSGDGSSGDGSFWANQYIDGLDDWDDRYQELCAE